MLQIISPKETKIVLEAISPKENIDMLNKHIKLSNCDNMTIDISSLNIMDACMISSLCSAEHYIKYPEGKIEWIVNSEEIENYTSKTSLGNSSFKVK